MLRNNLKVVLIVGAAALLGSAALKPQARTRWDMRILDGKPENVVLMNSTAVGDIDGDGRQEVFAGGDGALLWYRPSTSEKGKIADGYFFVTIDIEDIDGDGRKELVTGCNPDPAKHPWEICWFRPQGSDLSKPWTRGTIDAATTGGPHDLVFADLDGDGKRDLIADAMYTPTPGLFVYRRTGDPANPWQKSAVQNGLSAEGTDAGDFDGDGRPEIVSGPYWYKAPPAGPFSGLWRKFDLAPNFREMCRAAIIDVNGDGRPDVVLQESEYPDGHMSWFENLGRSDPRKMWREHPMEQRLNFAHTLFAWRDKDGAPNLFVAEMSQGGWDPPYNWNARLIHFTWDRRQQDWHREIMTQNSGTHGGVMADIDGDGELEVVGHDYTVPKVVVFKQTAAPSPADSLQHRFLDREKPYTCTDIVPADIDGDGREDFACGAWWYQNPGWERHPIPGIAQVINAYDVDHDGRPELIAIKGKPGVPAGDFYAALTSRLVWLKPVDPLKEQWTEHPIGIGHGDWPHSTAFAPLLPGGRVAMIVGYHNALEGATPELFELPDKPADTPWNHRVLADVRYGEQMVPADLNGDGKLDIAAGNYWLENKGDGNFVPHTLIDKFYASRVAVTDIDGDGKPDIVLVEEDVDYNVRKAGFARVAWIENPGASHGAPAVHIIDRVRSPHSLALLDLDGDGVPELLVGEHDPFTPYRSRSNLYAYKKADPKGLTWWRYVVDERFEHHDGLKLIHLDASRIGVLSHGWAEGQYVHLWEPATK